jgi:predicted ABC-type transport system involved in lysophospholipase L1 biosynthesis ATPase subunit
MRTARQARTSFSVSEQSSFEMRSGSIGTTRSGKRVALARALCLEPKLLLADEPTGNLDPQTAEGIHALLADLNARMGVTAVVVTHNERLAAALPRRLRLEAGRLA